MKIDFRDRILNISADMFREHGLTAVNMVTIAEKADISESSLKEIYQDKDILIHQLASLYFNIQKNYCSEHQNFDNAKQELNHIIEYCFDFLAEFTPSITIELQKEYHTVWKLYLHHRDNVIAEKIRINLRRGVKENIYRSDLNIDVTSKLYVEQIQFAFNQLIFPNEDYTRQEIRNIVLKNILYSICK